MNCPLCERAEAAPLFADARVRVVWCRACDLGRLADPHAELARINPAFVDHSRYYATRGVTTAAGAPTARRDAVPDRNRDIRRMLAARIASGGTVLDVGCGTGLFLERLRAESGLNVRGIEPDPVRAAEAARRGLAVEVGMFGDRAAGAATLDAITMLQVLEHVLDPLEVLRAAYRLLRPGGVLVVDVPGLHNPRILAYRATRLRALARRDFIPSHVWYFTRPALCRLLERAGFAVEQAVTGRYAARHAKATVWQPLLRGLDVAANRFGIGGIVVYAQRPA